MDLAILIGVFVALIAVLVAKRFFAAPTEKGSTPTAASLPSSSGVAAEATTAKRVTIVYATGKGTARSLAHKLFSSFLACRYDEAIVKAPIVMEAKDLDLDNLHKNTDLCVFIVSTYAGGVAPESAEMFSQLFKDMSDDFRFPRDHFAKMQFAVFGLGDMVYGDDFNKFAKDLSDWIRSLGGKFMTPPVYASEQRTQGLFVIFTKAVTAWIDKKIVSKAKKGKEISDTASQVSKSSTHNGPMESDSDNDNNDGEETEDRGMEDLEDLVAATSETNELLYPRLRQNLTKQGYSLIGTHSGVKLCRWTKSMLRGRGGCYKHTFYNISSFQCMEMTPSLACANKCVFCWRHHTNPVTKSFTWKHDPAEFLVENAIAAHRSMIKQMKGVPGVQADRYTEAMNVKHCALSLVGEPIIYPEINKFVSLLHDKHVSTFMVTNAQFPDRIRDLDPVTQLYVSIDAATKEDLKKIDRPVFEDFWERMLDCVKEIGLKRQRTVFRLTLVNDYNVGHLEEYAKLVRMGKPDFIEVKGMTYCGDGGASSLTMKNVPYHEEVVKFCEDLCDILGGGDYDIACEHEHSCCMLIAKKEFRVNGVWHTWIDYAKFFALVESGRKDFTSMDYAAATPSWAIFKSRERGFDPEELRHRRAKPITSGC